MLSRQAITPQQSTLPPHVCPAGTQHCCAGAPCPANVQVKPAQHWLLDTHDVPLASHPAGDWQLPPWHVSPLQQSAPVPQEAPFDWHRQTGGGTGETPGWLLHCSCPQQSALLAHPTLTPTHWQAPLTQ